MICLSLIGQIADDDLLQKITALMVWVDSGTGLIGSFCQERVNTEFVELKKEILRRMAEAGQNNRKSQDALDSLLKTSVQIIRRDSKTIQEKYWKARRQILEKMTEPLQAQKSKPKKTKK
ncbi:MAG: hypothetical protein AAB361_01225 [Patescibacteria group bacterium]